MYLSELEFHWLENTIDLLDHISLLRDHGLWVVLGRSYLHVFLEHVSQNCCGWTFRKMGGPGPKMTSPPQGGSCQFSRTASLGKTRLVILNWGFGFFGKLDPAPASSSNPSLPPLLVPGPLISPSRIQSRMPMPRHVAYRPRRTQLHLPPVSHACTPLHPPLPVVSLYCLITCDDACSTIRIWAVPHTRLMVCYSHMVRLNTQN